MKPVLNCEIVHDLLPLYLDQLTAPGTTAAVEEHLAGCAHCRAAKAAMAEVEDTPAVQENQKEVDYLKQVRRRGRSRVLLAVVCTVLVLVGVLGAKLFWIGQEADREGLSWSVQDNGNTLQLHLFTKWEEYAYRDWQVTEVEDGVVHVTARRVNASPLCSSRDSFFHINRDGLKKVYLFGQLLWQNDVTIKSGTLRLCELQTPYTGNAPALGAIASELGIEALCGPFTMELQTAAEPYGWTLHFSEPMGDVEGSKLNSKMMDHALLMLALVENLGQVSWTWADEAGEMHQQTVTWDAVKKIKLKSTVNSGVVPYEIDLAELKDFYTDPYKMELLRSYGTALVEYGTELNGEVWVNGQANLEATQNKPG